LDAGAMTASDISKKSGVPYSKIYEVLNTLEEKGWLESDSSRPQQFFPKSPSTALEVAKMKIETSFRESQSIIVNELMPIYTKSGIKERPEIWVARGVFNIAAKVNEIYKTASKNFLWHFLKWQKILPSHSNQYSDLFTTEESRLEFWLLQR
jgi:sugar-specific transcriptional regulator TrmB